MLEIIKVGYLHERRSFAPFLVILVALFGVLSMGITAHGEESNLVVTFIDAGQGDSILLESDGKTMLVDGGPFTAEETIKSFLKSKGIKKLDYILITHPHDDHIGGLVGVIKEFPVGKIIKNNAYYNTPYLLDILNLINKKNIPVINPVVGSAFSFGTARITYLAPNNSIYDSFNDNSIVVRVENGENSFLLAGDAEVISENEMLAKGSNLKSDVLKVGHHSALTSTSQAFLDAIDPSISIITCGQDNKSNFPRLTTMLKLLDTNIYRTDVSGNITMKSDGSKITVDKTPFCFAKDMMDNLSGVVTAMDDKESKNLQNLRVISSESDMELRPVGGEEAYEELYGGELTLNFMADCGISSLKKIEYGLVPIDQEYEKETMNWLDMEESTLTLMKDFVGCVYLRFTNNLGNTVVRKTDGITLDAQPPTKCSVVSNLSGIALVNTNGKNDFSPKASKPVTMTFAADYGVSESGYIEYMLVKREDKYKGNGRWKRGNTLTISKDFIGSVYVKFTDKAGNEIIKRTSGFSYVKKAPINTKVVTKAKGIGLVNLATKTNKSILVKGKVALRFTADFGASGKKSIEYMLVKKGDKFIENNKWIKKESVVVKKGFEGNVYVRFSDNKGNAITRKTNRFVVK